MNHYKAQYQIKSNKSNKKKKKKIEKKINLIPFVKLKVKFQFKI